MVSQTQKSKRKAQNDQSSLSSESTSDSGLSTSGRIARMTSKEPSTMEELLVQTGYTPHGLKRGQQVTGIVSSISPKEILIDIGTKTEGFVLEKDNKLRKELLSRLSLGDKVTAVVLSPESEYGYPVLSLRRELMDKHWNVLLRLKETDEEVEVMGVEVTRGGLLVDVLGMRGFIPFSHLNLTERHDSLIGLHFKAMILDLDRNERRIVLSQKGARTDSKKLRAILGKLEIGKEYEGVISGITNFGIFVKLQVGKEPTSNVSGEALAVGEVEGLVHISEISWEKVEDISKVFSIGDRVSVLVIGKDEDSLKLNLSLKQLTTDPWEEVAKMYAKDQAIKGVVSKISDFGIFVMLSKGIEGLIHKSKLPPGTDFTIGESVECIVESVDPAKRRIALAPLLKAKPVGYR